MWIVILYGDQFELCLPRWNLHCSHWRLRICGWCCASRGGAGQNLQRGGGADRSEIASWIHCTKKWDVQFRYNIGYKLGWTMLNLTVSENDDHGVLWCFCFATSRFSTGKGAIQWLWFWKIGASTPTGLVCAHDGGGESDSRGDNMWQADASCRLPAVTSVEAFQWTRRLEMGASNGTVQEVDGNRCSWWCWEARGFDYVVLACTG